jgi:Putative adhesin
MMNSNKIRFCFFSLLLVAFVLCGEDALAQNKEKEKYKNYDFCSDNWSNGDKVSSRDLRETTVSGGSLTVDGKRNGGISVKGENRSDILIRACVQAWAKTEEEAKSLAKSVRVETNGTVQAVGASEETNWSVSYQILVPRSTDLKLTTQNGGISIENVEGRLEFDAKNGGIHLSNLAGDVKGRTTNGGLHIELAGNTWKGSGLDVETTNGGVHLSMAENYAARFETKTTNGGFKSDIAALAVEKEKDENGYRRQGVNISRDINGGGALVRVVTTNGGVKIGSN